MELSFYMNLAVELYDNIVIYVASCQLPRNAVLNLDDSDDPAGLSIQCQLLCNDRSTATSSVDLKIFTNLKLFYASLIKLLH
jgi:hypothetical protein